jgi:centromere protein S
MSSRIRSEEDEVRAALQVAVAQICTSQQDGGAPMTKSAIQTLTELTYLYATTSLANDLVAFSVHANRRTITPDDVLLVARKNEDLLTKLKGYASSTNLLPVSVTAPIGSKSIPASKTLRATKSSTSSLLNTFSKHSPRRRHSASSSSSAAASPATTTAATAASSRYHRELRQRMLNGTDSERSSGDDDSVPLIPPPPPPPPPSNKVTNNKNGRVIARSKKQKSLMLSTKRKFIDSSSSNDEGVDDDDEPPIVTKRNKQKTVAAKTRTMEDISALLSSGEDSMDF